LSVLSDLSTLLTQKLTLYILIPCNNVHNKILLTVFATIKISGIINWFYPEKTKTNSDVHWHHQSLEIETHTKQLLIKGNNKIASTLNRNVKQGERGM